MGLDEAVEERGQRPEDRGQVAEVLELLPAAAYRVKLPDERLAIAHATGAERGEFCEIKRVGDQVRVVLAPQDPTRGRIVELL